MKVIELHKPGEYDQVLFLVAVFIFGEKYRSVQIVVLHRISDSCTIVLKSFRYIRYHLVLVPFQQLEKILFQIRVIGHSKGVVGELHIQVHPEQWPGGGFEPGTQKIDHRFPRMGGTGQFVKLDPVKTL